jgi:ubiquinone/menaquinone biosynthesis C-methylase UbiE
VRHAGGGLSRAAAARPKQGGHDVVSTRSPGRERDSRAYYDEFAGWYERERGRGYHRMVDDLEVDLVRRYGRGARVLEAGCGTGLLLERVTGFAQLAVGVDLSAGMLARCRTRGLKVAQGRVTALPYPDACFDVVYSVKVLAHVEDIRGALAELARVTRPGGIVLAEFYNPRSLRYLVKALKSPTAISAATCDDAVFTRYDTPADIRRYLPPDLRWETARGVRIATPVALAHRIPLAGRVLGWLERRLADLPGLRSLGGFVIAVLRKA